MRVLTAIAVLMTSCLVSAETIRGIDVDFVTIGNPGNPADTVRMSSDGTTGYGAVDYVYSIGKYEVSNSQWDQFVLSAGAPSGNMLGFDKGTFHSGAQKPVTGVSWYEAAMFCNWLTSGNKFIGVYDFIGSDGIGIYYEGTDREAALTQYGRIFCLPTEDEWYKAAYYKPDLSGYSLFTNGDTSPNSDWGWNFIGGEYGLVWDVGTGSLEQNGTFDMMGNVWEWSETHRYRDAVNMIAVKRGGSYNSNGAQLASYTRSEDLAHGEFDDVGFRIVSIVPEPCTFLLLSLGSIALGLRR